LNVAKSKANGPGLLHKSETIKTVVQENGAIFTFDGVDAEGKVFRGTCGLESDSDVLVDQVLAWDNSLFRRELGLLPEALIENIKTALRDFLDL
jgi:hypothetical protein